MEFIWYYKCIKENNNKQREKKNNNKQREKEKRERGYKLCYYISTKHQRQCQDMLSDLRS